MPGSQNPSAPWQRLGLRRTRASRFRRLPHTSGCQTTARANSHSSSNFIPPISDWGRGSRPPRGILPCYVYRHFAAETCAFFLFNASLPAPEDSQRFSRISRGADFSSCLPLLPPILRWGRGGRPHGAHSLITVSAICGENLSLLLI